jgi:hypothetical protein
MVDALDFRWPSREEITMKQHWGTDELVEHWTLVPRETELLTNKTGATRLGFALLLKFFQLEAYLTVTASRRSPSLSAISLALNSCLVLKPFTHRSFTA